MQAELYPSMYNRIKHADCRSRRHAGRGHRRAAAGRAHAAIVEKYVDDIVLVSEAGARARGHLLINIEKTVVGRGGAAGLAALLAAPGLFKGGKLVWCSAVATSIRVCWRAC